MQLLQHMYIYECNCCNTYIYIKKCCSSEAFVARATRALNATAATYMYVYAAASQRSSLALEGRRMQLLRHYIYIFNAAEEIYIQCCSIKCCSIICIYINIALEGRRMQLLQHHIDVGNLLANVLVHAREVRLCLLAVNEVPEMIDILTHTETQRHTDTQTHSLLSMKSLR